MTGQAGAHFVFEINEDDDRIYRKLSLKDLRRYLDRRILKGIPLAVFVCLLAGLLVAFAYDLLPSSACCAPRALSRWRIWRHLLRATSLSPGSGKPCSEICRLRTGILIARSTTTGSWSRTV